MNYSFLTYNGLYMSVAITVADPAQNCANYTNYPSGVSPTSRRQRARVQHLHVLGSGRCRESRRQVCDLRYYL